jgi:predicted pyridoxine 5'-phosphate oxidase superfamily flavin-nucleotide-binding protein
MMPDRRGNNRVDSLRNIVRDPKVALLFLIPGSGSTLRVNGSAQVSIDPDLLASFRVDGKAPRSVIVMTVHEIYFQCARNRAVGSVESRQADRSENPADAGQDPGGDEREQGWRRGIRPRLAGARAANDVVTGGHGSVAHHTNGTSLRARRR